MDKDQLESVTGLYYDELSLSNNYRSSSLLVSYFDYFKTYANKIEATGKTRITKVLLVIIRHFNRRFRK